MGPERTRPRQKVVAPSSEADTAGDISNPCSASASSILRCSARSVLKLRVPVAVVAFERGGGSARRDGGPSKCACIGGDRSARNIDSSGDFRDVKGAEQLLLVLDVMPSASARIELLAIVASQPVAPVRPYSRIQTCHHSSLRAGYSQQSTAWQPSFVSSSASGRAPGW